MPSITGRLDRKRAIIDVGVQPSIVFVPGVSPTQIASAMTIRPLRGLLDTGAQTTCITRSAARHVGLKPRGKLRLGNVSSVETHNALSFVLGVWYVTEEGDPLNETRGYYGFEPIFGADFKDNDDFDVLIGMDVIAQGDFAIMRNGAFRWDLP